MIDVRCKDAKKSGIATAVTCTILANAASSRSLITAGFRPYNPTKDYSLISEDMIHWRKDL